MTRLLSIAAALALSACANPGSAQAPVAPPTQRAPDVVFVPTPHKVVDQMLAVARAGPGDILYDLGSGDGRIVIAAARRFGIRATGIDIDPRRITESRFNADSARVTHLTEFTNADLFETDLSEASVVTLYLLPELNVRLRPKLFAELRPGSRVVSHSFGMGDWKADSTLMVDTRMVYYWVMPADISGDWSVTLGPRQLNVSITQQYQKITNSEVRGTGRIGVESAGIRGDSVWFLLRDAGAANATFELTGRVEGDMMRGTFTADRGVQGAWRASRLRRTGLVNTLPLPGTRRISGDRR
ncbi:MAG: class I SAM-dependent methyltransferase [Gemmatimonadaceae bacterium]